MIKEHLFNNFGFSELLPGQETVINFLIKGESSAAIFPTGGGKSLCYQLPALILDNLTLVVSPLISLMKDQIDFLKRKNIPAAKIDSTMDKKELIRVINDAKNGQLKILMISVERFRNERFRNQLKDMKISLLVVDEAHCISEWGHNFRPDYLKIPAYKKEFNIEQVLLLTATATPPVIKDMSMRFDIPAENVIITGFYRKNLDLKVTPSAGDKKNQYLIELLGKNSKQNTIVYVTLQKTAESVAELLNKNGITALPYHAGLKNEKREEIQDKFMNDEVGVIVATIAFGMGIDKKDIRRIIHYDLPKSLENYSQEIGRAGKDGKTSFCEVLAGRDNISILENFIYGDTPEESSIIKVLKTIKNNPEELWEVKLYSLSIDTDIRLLPLKTLLVYLELNGIIKSQFTYFQDYTFKFILSKNEIIEILKKYSEEVLSSSQMIFSHSITKKVWTTVDVNAIINQYNTGRERVIKALDFFNEQGWIELRSQQGVEVYKILDNNFNVNSEAEQLIDIFKRKEITEIKRIKKMMEFFESDSCLSKNLSNYFGEEDIENCSHCSVCKTGKAVIPLLSEKQSLTSFNYQEITADLMSSIGDKLNPTLITKFLCGILSPRLSKYRVKQTSNFALLENYPYQEVKNWVYKNYSV